MRKMLPVFFVVFVMACAVESELIFDIPILAPDVDTTEEVLAIVAHHGRWATDEQIYGVPDYWATPAETWWNGRGDCEDYSTLALYLLHRIGIEGQLVEGLNQYGASHTWIAVNGVWWETQQGIPVTAAYQVFRVFSYSETMAVFRDRQ